MECRGQAGRNGRIKKSQLIWNGLDMELKFKLCAAAVTDSELCLQKCREWQRITVHVIGTAKTFGAVSSTDLMFPSWRMKKKTHIILTFIIFFSLYIFPSGLLFSPCAPFVFASSFLFSLSLRSLARGEEDQSNPSARFLSSPAPYQRCLCLSSCPSAESLVDWKQISLGSPPPSPQPPPAPPHPHLSSNQTTPLSMPSVSLCLSFSFLFSFFFTFFPAFSLRARACTCSRPSLCSAPRLSGTLRWESVKSSREWPACKQSASMCGSHGRGWTVSWG